MDIKELQELAKTAKLKMDAGDFQGASNIVPKMQNLGSDYHLVNAVSGLLIDCGSVLGDETILNEGITLLQNNLEKIVQHPEYAPYAYYNIANVYSALFQLQRARDPYFGMFKETELNKAKSYFRKALKYNPQNDMLMSEILTNLGNCYDIFGRVLDALECYEEALKHKPNHGMALGNKALAIKYYAALAGEHERTYLLDAFSILSQALHLGVNPEVFGKFSKHLDDIKRKFSDKKILDNPPKFPGCTIKARSKFERYLV